MVIDKQNRAGGVRTPEIPRPHRPSARWYVSHDLIIPWQGGTFHRRAGRGVWLDPAARVTPHLRPAPAGLIRMTDVEHGLRVCTHETRVPYHSPAVSHPGGMLPFLRFSRAGSEPPRPQSAFASCLLLSGVACFSPSHSL